MIVRGSGSGSGHVVVMGGVGGVGGVVGAGAGTAMNALGVGASGDGGRAVFARASLGMMGYV